MRKLLVAALLCGFCPVATARGDDAGAADLFILARPQEKADWTVPLLQRELIRQAILIAARDEFGLYTRDAVLRETTPGNAGDVASRTFTPIVKLTDLHDKTQLLELDGPQGALWTKSAPVVCRGEPGHMVPDEMAMLPQIETWSRTDFVAALKKLGWAPKIAPAGQGVPSAAVETQLDEMSIISQFDAIRHVHGMIRQAGESPALLGALVRGYANLAQLTRFQWSAASDVFAARSLLYGQRLVVKYDSPLAHQEFAYALAMAGLHASALAELQKAPVSPDSPAWAGLIEPLCKYETGALLKRGGEQTAESPLAMYMTLVTVEHCGSVAAIVNAGRAALEVNPYCRQAVDDILRVGGVSTENQFTQYAITVDLQELRHGLAEIVDLPANVQTARVAAHANVDLYQDLADMSQSFVDAPDAAEPSWSALGRLLQESYFVSAYGETYHMAVMWGSDPSQFVAQSAPLVRGHPYSNLISVLGQYGSDGRQRPTTKAPIPWVDLQPKELGGTMAMGWLAFPVLDDFHDAWRQSELHADCTAYDMEQGMITEQTGSDDFDLTKHADALRWVSPFSPLGMAGLLVKDWAGQHGNLDTWLAQVGNQPQILGAAAKQLYAQGDYAGAAKYLRLYTTVAPDAWAYETLADCCLAQNDEAGWLQALQDGLNQEDFALDHAWMNDIIANHYMENHDYAKAEPYADAGAESWAAFSIICAMHCHVHLEDWNGAEMLGERESDRYGPCADWYLWCRASGKGNLPAARQAARTYVSYDSADPGLVACFYAGEGEKDNLRALIKQQMTTDNDPFWAVWLATIYDAAGQTADRDATLDAEVTKGAALVKDGKVPEPERVKFVEMLRDAAKGNGDLDMNAFHQAFDSLHPWRRAMEEYFAAEWLLRRGHADEGMDLLKTVAEQQNDTAETGWLARFELHDKGIDPYTLPGESN